MCLPNSFIQLLEKIKKVTRTCIFKMNSLILIVSKCLPHHWKENDHTILKRKLLIIIDKHNLYMRGFKSYIQTHSYVYIMCIYIHVTIYIYMLALVSVSSVTTS